MKFIGLLALVVAFAGCGDLRPSQTRQSQVSSSAKPTRSAAVATIYPELPEMPFAFPERSDEHLQSVVKAIQPDFEFPVQLRGPYELRQLEWIASNGTIERNGVTVRRDDFLPLAMVEKIRAVMDERTEVYYYESFLDSNGVVGGGESGFVVVRDGLLIVKLELMRV